MAREPKLYGLSAMSYYPKGFTDRVKNSYSFGLFKTKKAAIEAFDLTPYYAKDYLGNPGGPIYTAIGEKYPDQRIFEDHENFKPSENVYRLYNEPGWPIVYTDEKGLLEEPCYCVYPEKCFCG